MLARCSFLSYLSNILGTFQPIVVICRKYVLKFLTTSRTTCATHVLLKLSFCWWLEPYFMWTLFGRNGKCLLNGHKTIRLMCRWEWDHQVFHMNDKKMMMMMVVVLLKWNERRKMKQSGNEMAAPDDPKCRKPLSRKLR